MVSSSYAHIVLIEYLADVVGVDAAEGKRQSGAAQFDIARPIDSDVVAEASAEGVKRVLGDSHFVLPDVCHTNGA